MSPPTDDGKRGFYRSRYGIVFGVCRGLAERFDLSLFWVRVIVVALALLTTVWPVLLAYIVLALLLKKEPVVAFGSDADREFYDSYASSRTLALRRLKRAYDRLNRRIQRMEDRVTATDFDWDRRLHQS